MKRLLCGALAFCFLLPFVLLLAGCGKEQKKEVLRVYNWEDYISEPTQNSDGTSENDYVDLVAEFEKEYGVTVEYSTFGTNENMYNELKINPGAYDLVCPSDYMIMKMISEDMVEPFTDDFLQNSTYMRYASPYIKELFEEKGWTKYAVAYMWGTMGYVYNPELSDTVEEDLSSWTGLWQEKYASVATIKDSVRDSYFLGVAAVYRDELMHLKEEHETGKLDRQTYNDKVTEVMNRTDEATIEATKDALLQLKENLYGFEVDSGKQDMVVGRISINFAWSGDAVYTMDDAEPYFNEETGKEEPGIYLNYIVPEECSNIWFDGWVMPKGANVELAQKFYRFPLPPRKCRGKHELHRLHFRHRGRRRVYGNDRLVLGRRRGRPRRRGQPPRPLRPQLLFRRHFGRRIRGRNVLHLRLHRKRKETDLRAISHRRCTRPQRHHAAL